MSTTDNGLDDLDLSGWFLTDDDPHSNAHDSRNDGWPPSLPTGAFAAGEDGRQPLRAVERRQRRRHLDASEERLPQPGAIIDKYRLEEILGLGGFAVVYRATHLLLRTPVALKLVRPSVLERRPKQAQLLCEEARFAAQINHENVVRVFDVTHGPRMTYVVMEYIEGRSLAQCLIHSGKLTSAQVVHIGTDVVAGLAAGLAEGVVHRDVKPGNILLTRGGRAKLVDLGLALATQTDEEPRSDRLGLAAIGTPGYMAPEQARDPTGVTFHADVYSLGVTLLHALLGRPPFDRHDLQLPRPADLLPECDPRLTSLLATMVAPRPAARPESYAELRSELEAIARYLQRTSPLRPNP